MYIRIRDNVFTGLAETGDGNIWVIDPGVDILLLSTTPGGSVMDFSTHGTGNKVYIGGTVETAESQTAIAVGTDTQSVDDFFLRILSTGTVHAGGFDDGFDYSWSTGIQVWSENFRFWNEGTVHADVSNAIYARGSNMVVRNNGILEGNNPVIFEGDFLRLINTGTIEGPGGLTEFGAGGLRITGDSAKILNQGIIASQPGYYAGFTAMRLTGNDGYLRNEGLIDGSGTGLYVKGDGNKIVNTHEIVSFEVEWDTGVTLNGNANQLYNFGLIESSSIDGRSFGVTLPGSDNRLVNNGEITSDGYDTRSAAVSAENATGETLIWNKAGGFITYLDLGIALRGGQYADTVRNDGVIGGDVRLGAGDDLYYGTGSVSGGGRRGDEGGIVFGETGNDKMRGGAGDEIFNGGDGLDRLIGGDGADELTGGADADVFVFAGTSAGDDDTITDFTHDEDYLNLSQLGLTLTEIGGLLTESLLGDSILSLSNGASLTVLGVGNADLMDDVIV